MTSNTLTSLWVDPPAGWKYGFPKLWDRVGDMDEWIVAQGYPKKEMESYGKYFFVRQWEGNNEG